MSLYKITAALAATAMLAGCGSDSLATSTANQPPTFTNANFAIDYPENSTDTIITLAINDESAASVVITLGGPDRALFTINNGRDLNFINPPDFETPLDQGTDNVYEVTATATDSLGRSSTVNITVTVTDIATAQRFIDPVFDTATSLGTVAMSTPSGNKPVSFIAPSGDTLMARPLVIVGGGELAAAQAMAGDFALRGYVVGLTGTQAPGDLAALATAFGDGAFGQLGIDASSIAVAAPGDARFGQQLQAVFASSNVPTHAFATDATSAYAASVQFHEALVEGRR
ncbi:cadherin repeat domain-containing protein [Aurantiacibacter sp. MUD11]|uniref:cadherin repeat domain-containing protein n=1 Tax=Aurantiacibacter sp. MUD11 TaxID=3003265 RepID=UPI0022AA2964|nr:cadherin repeat domain-containing protein [Aurantiacibacter sp. MUD11]WAT17405.1 cadherin repeat domain-containing protein [Aurantiacibacter sp. MUD11]